MSRIGQGLSSFGRQLTTKVTTEKLNKAWKAAGSPTDSDKIFALIIKQGVPDTVVRQVYTDLNIAPPAAAATSATPAAGSASAADPDSTAASAAAPDGKIPASKIRDTATLLKQYGTGTGSDSPGSTGRGYATTGTGTTSTSGDTGTSTAAGAGSATTGTGTTSTSADTGTSTAAGSAASTASGSSQSAKMTADDIVGQIKPIWDKITANQDNPIGAPAVKQLIKSMWMAAGGTKVAESRRKNKKKVDENIRWAIDHVRQRQKMLSGQRPS